MPSIARKTKTPASASMITHAADRARPAKIRSPGRTTVLPVASRGGSVTDTGLLPCSLTDLRCARVRRPGSRAAVRARSSLRGDGADDVGGLLRELGVE